MHCLDTLDIEKRLLGVIVVYNEVYLSACSSLKPFHFVEPLHQRIYEAAGYLISTGTIAHPVTIRDALPPEQKTDGSSVVQYLGQLAADAIPFKNQAARYAREICQAGSSRLCTGWKSSLSQHVIKVCSDAQMSERGIGESPIERLFFAAATLVNFVDLYWFDFGMGPSGKFMSHVSQQEKIESYRVDFLITGTGSLDGINIVIECDGHDFHERTPEQALYDRQRDRRLQALGYYVLRFTGVELHTQPFACAIEVAQFLAGKSDDEAIRQAAARLSSFVVKT